MQAHGGGPIFHHHSESFVTFAFSLENASSERVLIKCRNLHSSEIYSLLFVWEDVL